MPRFTPKNPDFRRAATAVFDAQPAMRALGISIARLDAGKEQSQIETPPSAIA
jgi:hypothetical protein